MKTREKIKRRKNFFPTLLLAVLFWLVWSWLVYANPPDSNFILIIFFLTLFSALFLTSALLFANSRRGFLMAVAFIGLLLFRFFQISNFLNLGLFFGILICLELYFK